MESICPLVLCGGSGTRLWPLSRTQAPKQFMDIGERTLFAMTLDRAAAVPGAAAPIVICNERHRFLVAASVQAEGAHAQIILEPVGRNTAPATALGALAALEHGNDPLLFVLPADHLLPPTDRLRAAIQEAIACARDGWLVTFGVVPTHPETGYGYLLQGAPLTHGHAVARFTEKPDEAAARAMLAQGGSFWNSGMFMFRASLYLAELEKFDPLMARQCRLAWSQACHDADFTRPDKSAFEACPSESIDYAIMEKTDKAAMISLDTPWSDLGSWQSVYDSRQGDENGNVLIGDVIAESAQGNYLQATSRLVAALGVSGLVVVETPDAVLVADMKRSQDVRAIIARLGDRAEKDSHTRVWRPWGMYETISRADRFLVKRIRVNPGCALSLQRHYHRAEHWIVVRGTAEVTIGKKVRLLHEDESTYVPLGARHRLANPGRIPLELIEVQTGAYLEEDDIVRYDDLYGRK